MHPCQGCNGSGLINLCSERHQSFSPQTMCGTDAGPSPRHIGPQHLDSGQGTLSLPGLVQSPPALPHSPFLLGCLGGQLSNETSLGSSSVPSLSLSVGDQPPPLASARPPSQLLKVRGAWSFIWVITAGPAGPSSISEPSQINILLAAHYHPGLLP